MRTIFLSLFLVFFALLVFGQQPPNPPPPPPGEEEAPPPPPKEREEVRFFVAYKMKERLGLTDPQTLKVLEILKEGDESRVAHREKMKNLRQTAQKLLNNPKTPDQDFMKIVEEMAVIKKDGEAKMDDVEKKLLATFTPRQQLEWMLFKKECQQGPGAPEGRGGCAVGGEERKAPPRQRGR
jgi:hypothetical protein